MLDKTTEIKITDGVIDDSVPIQHFENYLKNALQLDIVLGMVQGITDSLLNKKKVTVQDIQHILERLTWLRDIPSHSHDANDINLNAYFSKEEIKALGYITSNEANNIIGKELKGLKLDILKTLPEYTQKQIKDLNEKLSSGIKELDKSKDIEDLKRQISLIQENASTLVRNIRELGSNNNKIDVKEIEKNIIKKLSEDFSRNEPEGEKQRYYRIFKVFTKNYDGLVPKPSDTDIFDNKVLRADGSWVIQSGGGGGAVDSVNGQTGTVVLASDPNLTITGDGLSGTEFKYNEVVVVVTSSTVFLTDADIYKTFTTDGSTNFDFDYTAITLPDFTFKVFVDQRSPAQITIPVYVGSIWLGEYEYVVSIKTAQKGASATVRLKNNRTNITNLSGNWEGI